MVCFCHWVLNSVTLNSLSVKALLMVISTSFTIHWFYLFLLFFIHMSHRKSFLISLISHFGLRRHIYAFPDISLVLFSCSLHSSLTHIVTYLILTHICRHGDKHQLWAQCMHPTVNLFDTNCISRPKRTIQHLIYSSCLTSDPGYIWRWTYVDCLSEHVDMLSFNVVTCRSTREHDNQIATGFDLIW